MPNHFPTTPEPNPPQETVVPAGAWGVADRYPPYGPDPGETGTDWRSYLAALWRYKWLALVVVVLGSAAGAFATRFIPHEYKAEATIWVEASSGGDPGGGPIRSTELLSSSAWVDLLKSYLVLDTVVADLRLFVKTDAADRAVFAGFRLKDRFLPGAYRLTVGRDGRSFELTDASGVLVQRGVLGDSAGGRLGFAWVPALPAREAGRTIDFAVSHPREVSSGLAERLQARMDRNGNFIRLSLTGREPERVATVLNAIAERHTAVAAELKREKLRQISLILDEQLRYAEQRLRDAETALERFRVRTVTEPTERASPVAPGLEQTRDPAFANFFNLKIEQDQIRRDRESVQRVLAQAPDSGLSVEALEFIPSVRNSSALVAALTELTGKRAELRALRANYSAAHPLVDRLVGEIESLESETIPELASRLVVELEARDTELEGLIASASRELRRVPSRAIEEGGLQRRVDIAANFYTELQLRHEQALLAAANSIPDLRLLDPAIAPQRPTNGKQKQRIALLAFMASVGLAVVGAILLDRIDPRLKYPDQVSQQLGLPVLGTIPHVPDGRGSGGPGGTAQVVEAFRLIRLGVIHAHGAAGPMVITVTSPAGAEGKSFVVANLALAFADLGRRTLAIDGDVRRGRLHILLGGERKPGLTDYLAGRVSRERVVQSTRYRFLDRIACGGRRQDGPELLQSAAMAGLLADLRSAYDVILVDTPPIGAGADALALGTLTGNMLIVLRTGATDRALTEAKLDILDRLPVRVLGAVLNDVPRRGVYRYDYHESYIPGYEPADEPDRYIEPAGEESAADRAPGESAPDDEPPGRDLGEMRGPGGPVEGPAPADGWDDRNPGGQNSTAADDHDAPGPFQDYPLRELHRQHQRRSQLRQWKRLY